MKLEDQDQAAAEAAELLVRGFAQQQGRAPVNDHQGGSELQQLQHSQRSAAGGPAAPLPAAPAASTHSQSRSQSQPSRRSKPGGGAGTFAMPRGKAAKAAQGDATLHPVLRLGWQPLCSVVCNGLTGDFLGGHGMDLYIRCTAPDYALLPLIDVNLGGCIMTCSQFEKAAGRELSKKWKESIHVVGEGVGSVATLISWMKRKAAQEFGTRVVGKVVWVCWCGDLEFYQGRIASYSRDSGKHTVQYSDSHSEELHLPVELLSFEPTKPRPAPTFPAAAAAMAAPRAQPARGAEAARRAQQAQQQQLQTPEQQDGTMREPGAQPGFSFPHAHVLESVDEDLWPPNPLWHQGSGISVTSSFQDDPASGPAPGGKGHQALQHLGPASPTSAAAAGAAVAARAAPAAGLPGSPHAPEALAAGPPGGDPRAGAASRTGCAAPGGAAAGDAGVPPMRHPSPGLGAGAEAAGGPPRPARQQQLPGSKHSGGSAHADEAERAGLLRKEPSLAPLLGAPGAGPPVLKRPRLATTVATAGARDAGAAGGAQTTQQQQQQQRSGLAESAQQGGSRAAGDGSAAALPAFSGKPLRIPTPLVMHHHQLLHPDGQGSFSPRLPAEQGPAGGGEAAPCAPAMQPPPQQQPQQQQRRARSDGPLLPAVAAAPASQATGGSHSHPNAWASMLAEAASIAAELQREGGGSLAAEAAGPGTAQAPAALPLSPVCPSRSVAAAEAGLVPAVAEFPLMAALPAAPAAPALEVAPPPPSGHEEARPSVMARWLHLVSLQLEPLLAVLDPAAHHMPAPGTASLLLRRTVSGPPGDGGPGAGGVHGSPPALAPSACARFQAHVALAAREGAEAVRGIYEAMLCRYDFFCHDRQQLPLKLCDLMLALLQEVRSQPAPARSATLGPPA